MKPSQRLDERLQDKATHVANHLNALTPTERALVLREAHALCYHHRRKSDRDPAPLDILSQADLSNLETHEMRECLRLVQIFGRIPSESRALLLSLATEMDVTQRFKRLMESGEPE